jgi:hypothetical protein
MVEGALRTLNASLLEDIKTLKHTVARLEIENAHLLSTKQASRTEILSFLSWSTESLETQLMSSQAESELLQLEISSLQREKTKGLKVLAKSTLTPNVKKINRDVGVQTETLQRRDAGTACNTKWWGLVYDASSWADDSER